MVEPGSDPRRPDSIRTAVSPFKLLTGHIMVAFSSLLYLEPIEYEDQAFLFWVSFVVTKSTLYCFSEILSFAFLYYEKRDISIVFINISPFSSIQKFKIYIVGWTDLCSSVCECTYKRIYRKQFTVNVPTVLAHYSTIWRGNIAYFSQHLDSYDLISNISFLTN